MPRGQHNKDIEIRLETYERLQQRLRELRAQGRPLTRVYLASKMLEYALGEDIEDVLAAGCGNGLPNHMNEISKKRSEEE
jgi:hypothetical protein